MRDLAKRIERATSNSFGEVNDDREKIWLRAQELIAKGKKHTKAYQQAKEEFIEHLLRETTILLN